MEHLDCQFFTSYSIARVCSEHLHTANVGATNLFIDRPDVFLCGRTCGRYISEMNETIFWTSTLAMNRKLNLNINLL